MTMAECVIAKVDTLNLECRFLKTLDAENIVREVFNDTYGVIKSKMTFSPGDVIIDLGANEGVFSIYMAKLFPQTVIYAFEPVKRTFETLQVNLRINDCKNVTIFNEGVAGQAGFADLIVSKDHSGGSTALCTYNKDHHDICRVNVDTIDNIFQRLSIDRCRLLKVDIEGMEYEALYASTMIGKIDYIAAEFHINNRLDFMGRRQHGLLNWLSNHGVQFTGVTLLRMAE